MEELVRRENVRKQLSDFDSIEKMPEDIQTCVAVAREFANDRNQKYELALGYFLHCIERMDEIDESTMLGPGQLCIDAADCIFKLAASENSGQDRVDLFRQARKIMTQRLDDAADDDRRKAAESLEWLKSFELTPCRNPDQLDSLPEAERKAWSEFWSRVRSKL